MREGDAGGAGPETGRSHAHLGTEQPERDRDAEVEATLPMVFTPLDPPVDVLATAIPSRIRESHTRATAFSIRTSVLRVLRGVGPITAASLIARSDPRWANGGP